MGQLHKRFTDEQVRVLFQGYVQGQLSRADLEEMMGIGKTRFFALLKRYRQDPASFSLAERETVYIARCSTLSKSKTPSDESGIDTMHRG